MESLPVYLFRIDDSFEAFQRELWKWKRNDDSDLRLYYGQKDAERSDRLRDPKNLIKNENDYMAEALRMMLVNKELEGCCKRGGKFCEVGSALGGQVP